MTDTIGMKTDDAAQSYMMLSGVFVT
jgi:hypothetical protein